MGYDGAMLIASIVLLIPLLVVGSLIFALARRLRFVPRGIAALPAFGLIILGGYAIFFLATSVQTLVTEPLRLQSKYLGQAYGTPTALRSYEHSGFMDPVDEWTYSLRPDVVVRLRHRCLSEFTDRAKCHLFSRSDDRWDASVWLEGGNLHILDGLH